PRVARPRPRPAPPRLGPPRSRDGRRGAPARARRPPRRPPRRGRRGAPARARRRRAGVLLAPRAGADPPALERLRFDPVVLDEATQAVDPLALIPLLRAPRAVLAGGPHQLPPTGVES